MEEDICFAVMLLWCHVTPPSKYGEATAGCPVLKHLKLVNQEKTIAADFLAVYLGLS